MGVAGRFEQNPQVGSEHAGSFQRLHFKQAQASQRSMCTVFAPQLEHLYEDAIFLVI